MSHVLAVKGWSPKASRATPTIGASRVEVGTYHDGFCDSLATVIAEARCGVGDNGPAH